MVNARRRKNALILAEKIMRDVILSDDGRAAPSLGVQPMVGDNSGFSATTIFFFFLTRFPSYLNHSLHLDIKEIIIAAVIPLD